MKKCQVRVKTFLKDMSVILHHTVKISNNFKFLYFKSFLKKKTNKILLVELHRAVLIEWKE